MTRFLKLTLLGIFCFSVLATGCGSTKTAQVSPDKIKVAATVYPVYEFARHVGGDKVDVEMLLPPGAEPHDWEPAPSDIMKVKRSKLLLYHGAGLESIDKLLTQEVLGSVKAAEVSKGIPVLITEQTASDAGTHKHSSTGEHGDVHIWLDPVYAQQEVKNIAAALTEADPKNGEYYKNNADRYIKELEKLDKEYRDTLSNVKRRDIITSHTAFSYLAKRYGLQQVGIMGLAPDSEPTSSRMAQVVDFCRQRQVKYIFFETLVSPKLAGAIAREAGAQLLVLNPIENLTEEEVKQGKDYLKIMRENLANLSKALNE